METIVDSISREHLLDYIKRHRITNVVEIIKYYDKLDTNTIIVYCRFIWNEKDGTPTGVLYETSCEIDRNVLLPYFRDEKIETIFGS